MTCTKPASEMPTMDFVCGNALTTPGGGVCKSCSKGSGNLMDGLCMGCMAAKGLNPLRSCGCKPIKLTSEATAGTAGK